MGLTPGPKAFVAAVVGGIGSIQVPWSGLPNRSGSSPAFGVSLQGFGRICPLNCYLARLAGRSLPVRTSKRKCGVKPRNDSINTQLRLVDSLLGYGLLALNVD